MPELNEPEEAIEFLENQVKKLKNVISELEDEVDKLKEEIRDLENDNDDIRDEKEEIQDELDALKNEKDDDAIDATTSVLFIDRYDDFIRRVGISKNNIDAIIFRGDLEDLLNVKR